MVNPIKQARQTRGWTSADLIDEIHKAARQLKVRTAGFESLRVMISSWENGRQTPDTKYRALLTRVLDLPPAALGFPADDTARAGDLLAPLVHRNVERLEVTDSILGYFLRQFAELVQLDNETGPGLVLDVFKIQVEHVRRLAEQGASEAVALASRFTEYAGWLHQDLGDSARALQLSEEAVDLAGLVADAGLTAYTLMRKSNVLTTFGQGQRAAMTARRAADLAAREAPAQHAVCLRQVAPSEAAQGNESAARDAIEHALVLLAGPAEEPNALSPYCTPAYIEMEHALCLLVLDQPAAAADACLRALDTWPAGLVRDEGLCLVRLAVAQLRNGQVDEACAAAVQAVKRVQVAPSARTLEQLRAVSREVAPYQEARSVRWFRQALAQVA